MSSPIDGAELKRLCAEAPELNDGIQRCSAGHRITTDKCHRCGATSREPCREWVRNVDKENDALKAGMRALLAELEAVERDNKRLSEGWSQRLAAKDAEIERLKAALATCQQSLEEQAAARRDPTMPVLKPEVLADIRSDAEAQWAFASGSKGRIRAHGLMLLCDWQDRARAARSEAPTVSTKQLELLKQAETEIHFPGTAKEQGIDLAALIRDAIEEAEAA
jgi:hypothetical protein